MKSDFSALLLFPRSIGLTMSCLSSGTHTHTTHNTQHTHTHTHTHAHTHSRVSLLSRHCILGIAIVTLGELSDGGLI